MEKKNSSEKFTAFRLLLLGRSGVGKTMNGLKWALDLVEKGVFEPQRVLLISKTWKSDPSQEAFVKYCAKHYKGWKENNAFEDVDVDILAQIFDT
jgi:hypothetical protein